MTRKQHLKTHLSHILDVDNVDALLDRVWYVVLDIGSASGGSDDLLDASAVSGEDFLLESADGKDLSCESHLSGHGCYDRVKVSSRARSDGRRR